MSIRTIFFIPCYLVLTVVFSILALLLALIDPSGNRSHRIASLWASSALFLAGVRVNIHNMDLISPDQSYIYAANHQSAFDILVLLGKLNVQFRWLAKDTLFKIPLFGWAMKRTGYIPINRSNPKQAYQSLLQAAKKVNEGTSVVIFPEGTRQDTETLGEFKKGGFILALKSKKPIVPVGIQGSARVKHKKGLKITPGIIQVVIGKPIPTEGYHTKDAEILMVKVRAAIEENLKQ
jgi:1-acyl-sn-glycerol-3-phosphate acyltransferase